MNKLLALSMVSFACTASPPAEPDPAAIGQIMPASAPPPARTEVVNPRLLRRFKSVHAPDGRQSPEEVARVALGRMLFFDKRLSRDLDLSCNSCHQLDRYGVDHQPTSIGAKGQHGRRNSPTVFHAAGAFTSFWDGRSPDVEDQSKVPIVDPAEMAMADGAAVTATLLAVPGYVAAFHAAFPDATTPVTYDNVGRAIGAFERGLVTPSRWDRFLDGDATALTPDEVAGFKLFADVGCISCHTGELVGGSMFQRAGFVKPWPNQADLGRYEITKVDADKMMFKVPTLRNIAMTAPYFHDGSGATLVDASGRWACTRSMRRSASTRSRRSSRGSGRSPARSRRRTSPRRRCRSPRRRATSSRAQGLVSPTLTTARS
ncbi:MAG: cytochrome-c peroxidase [Proteobacteria bacterium]|nr:cytochrome-c peroxidase [Pseudomonadota bacterium]